MPAVTVENPLTLPRLPEPQPGTPGRKVLAVETAPSGFEGEGFPYAGRWRRSSRSTWTRS
ncbi:hypothetical protein ACFQQB_13310 [Nonomuraea rubra]|uniref:hypothetical protein n=1 Tax=Nonomuraea rubra TaxID=46180 RepID=UPI00360A9A69